MKNWMWLFSLTLFLHQISFSQYLKFDKASNGTNVITVPSNEYWQVISYSTTGWDWVGAIYSSTNQTAETLIGRIPSTRGLVFGPDSGTSGNPGSAFAGVVIPGPACIYFYENSVYYLLCKKLNAQNGSSVSSSSVVIPDNLVGNVEIKVEKSSDNINWVEALPGTYNTSTQKNIFRLRAIGGE